MWNRDADWANNTAVVRMNQALTNGAARSGVTNYVVLDMSASLNGHRLCERGVGLLEERGLTRWTQPGAADLTEWVSQIRTVTTIFGPYQLQEGLHASYWGQLAMRNCLRQAYNNGNVRGGRCTSAGGVNCARRTEHDPRVAPCRRRRASAAGGGGLARGGDACCGGRSPRRR